MKALDLAKYIITKCWYDEKPITYLHLQKILWLLFEDVYKFYNVFLFTDRIEARGFGPTVPVIFNDFGANGVFEILAHFDDIDYKFDNVPKDFIDKKIEEYRNADLFELVGKSCENEPYKITRKKNPDNVRARIPLSLIEQYL